MHRDCDPVEQQKVQDRLEAWYLEDGRDNPEHPLYSVYTGLAEKFNHQQEQA
jgi:hypothetical protein